MGCVGNVDWRDGEVELGGICGITGVFWWNGLLAGKGTGVRLNHESTRMNTNRRGLDVDPQVWKCALHGRGRFDV
jgi:hypothetical protein